LGGLKAQIPSAGREDERLGRDMGNWRARQFCFDCLVTIACIFETKDFSAVGYFAIAAALEAEGDRFGGTANCRVIRKRAPGIAASHQRKNPPAE